MAEECDSLQGIMVIAGLGGASGSVLMDHVKDYQWDFGFGTTTTWNIFPTDVNAYDNAWTVYNIVFPYFELVEYTMCTMYDNSALLKRNLYHSDLLNPTFTDLNRLIVHSLSCITGPFRFKSLVNNSLMKLATNLIHFPRVHYMSPSLSPIRNLSSQGDSSKDTTAQELQDE